MRVPFLPPRRARALLGRVIAAGVFSIIAAAVPPRTQACDLCAIYTATEQRVTRVGPWLGIAEQFTSYDTLQVDGDEIPNPDGQYLNSSITQFVLGYTVLPKLSLQANIPFIARNYRRPENGHATDGDETGLGDIVLLGNLEAFSTVTEKSIVRLSLLAGIKLPTGSPSRLKEELPSSHHAEHDMEESALGFGLHHDHDDGEEDDDDGVASGVHGHDLALGSGSTDALLGAQAFANWDRFYVSGALQYLARTTGSYNYTYANTLLWSGGPGLFLVTAHDYTVSTQAVVSGESKGNDSLSGVPLTDTAITTLYIGPAVAFTWGSSLAVEVAGDLPVIEHNSSLQIVPDYRIRSGATWRF